MRCIRLNISKAFSLNLKKNGFSLKGKYIHNSMATPWEKITQCNALGKDNPMATPWEKITQWQRLGEENRTLCQRATLSSIRQKTAEPKSKQGLKMKRFG